MGLRFRLHRRPIADLRRQADLIFPSSRVAVFVDGCFWHGCPQHGSLPKANRTFWREKIERNIARDADTDERLGAAGWRCMRIWEHENVVLAARKIARVVRRGG